jgi:hypothetical protein
LCSNILRTTINASSFGSRYSFCLFFSDSYSFFLVCVVFHSQIFANQAFPSPNWQQLFG